MEHEKYIVISSKHSKHYFPNNRPSHFRVCLEHYIDFEHPYECALMDFTCSTTKFETPAKSVFMYFNDIRTTDRWQHRQSHEAYYCATLPPRNGKIYIAILHSSKANQNQHIGGVYKR